jgi:hypothetical protein
MGKAALQISYDVKLRVLICYVCFYYIPNLNRSKNNCLGDMCGIFDR